MRPPAELQPVDAASPRARAVRRAFIDHVKALVGEEPLVTDDPLDDGDPHLDGDCAPPRGAFWLAVAGGQDVGCVGARALDDATVEVKRVYVAPAARGLGLGRAMLDAVEAWARARGAQRTVLDTSSRLGAAARLYAAAGYVPVPAYNDSPYADRWYAKDLAPR